MTADRPTTEPRPVLHSLERIEAWSRDWKGRQRNEMRSAMRLIHDEAGAALETFRAEAAQGAAPLDCKELGEAYVECQRLLIEARSGAAPRAEGLDPRRLFDEMWAERDVLDAGIEGFSPNRYRSAARRIVARLSRPSDERDPESEEPR